MEKLKMSKKQLNGKVVKDQNDKTVVVLVKRRYAHPFFGKVITSSKKYHAHDENNKFKNGDSVKIIESRPYSKKKKWKVMEK
jgi:small subunit ribosomal protein S17